ncbi:hypothetical protein HK104_005190 [Borealophlyctis nickersoniae]|nr:hypothetical protein HK104_005190 [Borealophlyctis nickersoniae]
MSFPMSKPDSVVDDLQEFLKRCAASEGKIRLAVFQHITSPAGIHPSHHSTIHPLVTTWGHGQGLHAEFIWQGTADYSPFLSLRTAVAFYDWVGYDRIVARNHALAVWCANVLVACWRTERVVPFDEMVGSMCCVRVPNRYVGSENEDGMVACGGGGGGGEESCGFSSLQDALLEKWNVEVPVFAFKGKRWIRVSLHIYNEEADCFRLAEAVLGLQNYPHSHENYQTLHSLREQRCGRNVPEP